MENILKNEGLIDIREQIFRHFDRKTLVNCREVFGTRYGEDWDLWLEKLILVQSILEFSDKDFIPEWDKAVKKYGKTASLEDLDEVKESLLKVYSEDLGYLLFFAAGKGHVKLMELLLYTDFTEYDGNFAFLRACEEGHTEIVNLMMNASKEHGINLNASVYDGDTGLMYAIRGGHPETAKLMIENRSKYGINIRQENNFGDTALDYINEKIEYYKYYLHVEEKKALLKELKAILEEDISADNEPEPSV